MTGRDLRTLVRYPDGHGEIIEWTATPATGDHLPGDASEIPNGWAVLDVRLADHETNYAYVVTVEPASAL